jgi:hypothetical protein
MEFTSEMINKLNIVEKNLLIELYNKCQVSRVEDRIHVPSTQKEWTIPGPAASNLKVLLNPLATAGIITKVGYSTGVPTSSVGHA